MSSALHAPLAALNAFAAQAHELLGHYGLPLLVLLALAVPVVMVATVHLTEPRRCPRGRRTANRPCWWSTTPPSRGPS